jgi:UDP-glucose:(heptosyl)LPS alpha-1,3-glucosyltransferase
MSPLGARSRARVALVAHGVHGAGGMERAFAELVRRAGEEVDFVVLAAELGEDLRPLVEWQRICVPKRPIPLKIVVFAVRAGLRLRRVEVDLVHTLGAIVPNRADLAAVHFCHAGLRAATGRLSPESAPPLRRLNTSLARLLALAAERWCYRSPRLRLFGAVSPGVARELERHYPGIPTVLTPNGVDAERFAPSAAARSQLREQEGVSANEVVVLFVGGDWARKGLGVAIEAVAAAGSAAPLRLWVVGSGDEARLGALAKRVGIADQLRFFGVRVDTERFFQAADIFVLPTLYETFSLVAYEAAAAGLPIVATRVSGIDELVGGEAGLLVERTAQSVGEALARLAADPELRSQLGAEGRRRALRFGWEQSAASILAAYERLLGAEERAA